jgi:hypothetical protein
MKYIVLVILLTSCASFHTRGLSVYDNTDYNISSKLFDDILDKSVHVLGNRFDHYSIYLYPKLIYINGPNNTVTVADGFTDDINKIIIINMFTACLPASALIHELAHTVYGDQHHYDKNLWKSVAKLEHQLQIEMCTKSQILTEQERRLPPK